MEREVTADFHEQLAELTSVHRQLTNITERQHEIVVSGSLPFEAFADGLETIRGSFDIELTIPRSFPESLPRVRETGRQIESSYPHLNPDGTLCLALPVEQRRVLREQPTFLEFVNRLVIPFLYGYSYWKKHGQHPFGEQDHGDAGVLRYYLDTLQLRDKVAVLAVLSFLLMHGYRGHHDCPCGSGLRVRGCHGTALLQLYQLHTRHTLQSDFLAVLRICIDGCRAGRLSIPQSLRRQVDRILRKLSRR